MVNHIEALAHRDLMEYVAIFKNKQNIGVHFELSYTHHSSEVKDVHTIHDALFSIKPSK